MKGRVLVIDADASAKELVEVLQERGFTVNHCEEAILGFRKATETLPDLVVIAPDLPDIDGAWVARKIRTEPSIIAKTPILFVGDRSVRTQTLNVGADVFLGKPVAPEEIAAQVEALIAMARRYEGKPTGEGMPSSTSFGAAIRGDLSAFPLASMLMMFEMERRSGLIEVVAQSGRRASVVLNDGMFASTDLGGTPRPALDVLREVLSWRAGRFSFQPRESRLLPEPRATIGALVLEAMRLEDEEKGPMPELDSDDLEEAPPSIRNPISVPRPRRAPSVPPPK